MILLTFNIISNKRNFKKNYSLTAEEILDITYENTCSILRILEIYNIRATFFVEVSIALHLKSLLKKIIGTGNEIGLYSENSTISEIAFAKNEIETFIQKKIRGIRQKEILISVDELKNLEFSYISNIENADILFPLKRLKRTTAIELQNGVNLLPESISPYSQLPYNDFVFQITPLQIYKSMILETIKNDDFVLIYLNSWQFTNFEKYRFEIPFYRKYNSGKKMEDKLENLLGWINDGDTAFSRIKDFIL